MVVVLDSSVIAAFLSERDLFHGVAETRLRELAARERLVASAVSYAELLVGARSGRHDETVVRGFFDDLIDEVAPVDRRAAESAALLRGRRRALRLADALVLGTAAVLDAGLVLTADQAWEGILEGGVVQVLDPGYPRRS